MLPSRQGTLELSERSAELVDEALQTVQLDTALSLGAVEFKSDALAGGLHGTCIPDGLPEPLRCKPVTATENGSVEQFSVRRGL